MKYLLILCLLLLVLSQRRSTEGNNNSPQGNNDSQGTNCTSFQTSYDLFFQSPVGTPVFLIFDVNENLTEYRNRAISFFQDFGINTTSQSGYDITFSIINPDFPYFVYSAHGNNIKSGIPSSNIKVFQSQFAVIVNDQNGIDMGQKGKLLPGQTLVYGEVRFLDTITNEVFGDTIIFKSIHQLDPSIDGYLLYLDLESNSLGKGYAIGASVVDLGSQGNDFTVASIKLNFPKLLDQHYNCKNIQMK